MNPTYSISKGNGGNLALDNRPESPEKMRHQSEHLNLSKELVLCWVGRCHHVAHHSVVLAEDTYSGKKICFVFSHDTKKKEKIHGYTVYMYIVDIIIKT